MNDFLHLGQVPIIAVEAFSKIDAAIRVDSHWSLHSLGIRCVIRAG